MNSIVFMSEIESLISINDNNNMIYKTNLDY